MNHPRVIQPGGQNGGMNLELPEFTLPQPNKHGTFLLFHPQLVVLFQLFPFALAVKRGGQIMVPVGPAQRVCLWKIEAEIEITKEEKVRGFVNGSWSS